jgi:hypothetical protein
MMAILMWVERLMTDEATVNACDENFDADGRACD